jgi:2-dehydro-3-deoxy-L-rhamnonate dehydrogenase (NAD+)
VTGGLGGIGSAVAKRLIDAGGRVWIWDIDREELAGALSLPVDVTNHDQVAVAVEEGHRSGRAARHPGQQRGPSRAPRAFEQLSPEEWRRIIDVNLVPCHHVLPHLRRGGGGRIVNIGSLAGKQGPPKLPVYSAASVGVIAFTKALAQELAATEIRVNSVPGADRDRSDHTAGTRRRRYVRRSAACSFNTGAVFDLSGGRAPY